MKLTVKELAKRLGARLVGDGSGIINAVGALGAAGANDVSFAASDKHLSKLAETKAGAVIASKEVEGFAGTLLVVENVNKALIEVLGIFAPELKPPAEGADPTAVIGENVQIGKSVSIGAGVVIADGVVIGENSVIAAGCKIGQDATIGKNCRLDFNVAVYHRCFIGNNVIIQANSTIGSTGFGYSFIDGAHRLIPHNGVVVIEDFVEIGANCCVDRAKFGQTRIGAGTKIDNLVQIAHNVVIGKCCLIAGQAGIGGSAKLGNGVMMAGQSGVLDNIEIGDGVIVGARSCVLQSVEAGKRVLGMPAVDNIESIRIFHLTKRLPEIFEQVKKLKDKVERLEVSKDDKNRS